MRRLSLLIVVLLLTPALGEDEAVRSAAESTPPKADQTQVAPAVFPYLAPLSASEVRLVGQWKQTILPRDEEGPSCTFSPGRVFRSNSGLAGRWWVSDEQLHVQYWTDKQSPFPFADLLRGWQAQTDTWRITFNNEGDRVELAPPNKATEAVFTRLKDEVKRSVTDRPLPPSK